MAQYDQAPKDGAYTVGRGKYRVKAGGRVPKGATFVPSGVALSAPLPDALDTADAPDYPKWFLAKAAKAAKAGYEIPPPYEGETQSQYETRKERAAPGPDETT